MPSGPSLSRRGVLLIAIISPLLLGSEWKCAAVSNPSVVTARIEQLEPSTPRVGDIVQVAGAGNGTPPLQFAWDFGDGTLAAGMQAAHVYLAAGTYRLRLTVRDANGGMDNDESQVIVSARQSSSVLSVVPLSSAVAGQPVTFVTLPLEQDADELNYVWTFSDGQSAIGSQVTATFPTPGAYLASVSVTNRLGEISIAQVRAHVVDGGAIGHSPISK